MDWTYRKVPKVSSFRSFERIPSWCRKPQAFTYHVCAEDITKTVIVPYLSDCDRQRLEAEGTIPPESSAKGWYCVMCPVEGGLQDSSHVVCATTGVTFDAATRLIWALITGPTIRTDTMNIERDIEYRQIYEDTSASRWSPFTWVNLLLEKHAWISAGLVWMHGASDSGTKGAPTINLFELWETVHPC